MPLVCVNNGGEQSRIRLTEEVALEQAQSSNLPKGVVDTWQLRPGQIVTALSAGGFYRCRISKLTDHHAELIPFQLLSSPESPLTLTVAQAVPGRERFELVLEKLTELGVARIIPLVTEHSSSTVERDSTQKKSHRWPDVIRRAARQCRRGTMPELMEETDLRQLLEATKGDHQLVLDEQERSQRLSAITVAEHCGVTLIVGPEGGFARNEIDLMRLAGVTPITLGGRILRTETAAIIGAALVQAQWGDLR